jgi:hypothetical protein
MSRGYVKVSLNGVLLQDLEQLAFHRQLTPQAYISDLLESHIAAIRLSCLKPPPGTGTREGDDSGDSLRDYDGFLPPSGECYKLHLP